MENHLLSCTFCKRSEKQVRKLVAGPGVYICDRCTEHAHAIIQEDHPSRAPLLQRVKLRLSRLVAGIGWRDLHRAEGRAT
jgi:ATP-dependent protease Clp ATPase subunit